MTKKKITFATVRSIGMKFPHVEARTTWGSPALKVHGRMFTCMAINRSAEPDTLVVCIDFDQRDALIADDPKTYYLTDHYVNYPSVLVRLSEIHPDALRDLLHASWRFISARATKPRRRTSATRPSARSR